MSGANHDPDTDEFLIDGDDAAAHHDKEAVAKVAKKDGKQRADGKSRENEASKKTRKQARKHNQQYVTDGRPHLWVNVVQAWIGYDLGMRPFTPTIFCVITHENQKLKLERHKKVHPQWNAYYAFPLQEERESGVNDDVCVSLFLHPALAKDKLIATLTLKTSDLTVNGPILDNWYRLADGGPDVRVCLAKSDVEPPLPALQPIDAPRSVVMDPAVASRVQETFEQVDGRHKLQFVESRGRSVVSHDVIMGQPVGPPLTEEQMRANRQAARARASTRFQKMTGAPDTEQLYGEFHAKAIMGNFRWRGTFAVSEKRMVFHSDIYTETIHEEFLLDDIVSVDFKVTIPNAHSKVPQVIAPPTPETVCDCMVVSTGERHLTVYGFGYGGDTHFKAASRLLIVARERLLVDVAKIEAQVATAQAKQQPPPEQAYVAALSPRKVIYWVSEAYEQPQSVVPLHVRFPHHVSWRRDSHDAHISLIETD